MNMNRCIPIFSSGPFRYHYLNRPISFSLNRPSHKSMSTSPKLTIHSKCKTAEQNVEYNKEIHLVLKEMEVRLYHINNELKNMQSIGSISMCLGIVNFMIGLSMCISENIHIAT